MTAQVVAIEEPIEGLTEMVEAYGDIPAVVASRVDGPAESVGRPRVLSLPRAGAADNFQAHALTPRKDTPKTEAALIR